MHSGHALASNRLLIKPCATCHLKRSVQGRFHKTGISIGVYVDCVPCKWTFTDVPAGEDFLPIHAKTSVTCLICYCHFPFVQEDEVYKGLDPHQKMMLWEQGLCPGQEVCLIELARCTLHSRNNAYTEVT